MIKLYYTERLKDLREDKDWTQEDVAKYLHLKREQYRRYETGINEIKVSFLIKVCKLYNVSADYVLGFTNELKELPRKWEVKMFNLAIVADQLKNIDMQNIFAKFFIPFVILAFMIVGCIKGISYIWNLIK